MGEHEEIIADLEAGDRKHFVSMLQDWITNWNPGGLEAFALKAPDRYLQGLTMQAKLAGYRESLALDINVQAKARELSDAELLRALADLQARISALQPLDQRSIPASTTDPA